MIGGVTQVPCLGAMSEGSFVSAAIGQVRGEEIKKYMLYVYDNTYCLLYKGFAQKIILLY